MADLSLAPAAQSVSAARKQGRRWHKATPILFLLPPLLLYAMWVIGPMFYSVWMSFTNADGISRQDFVGLANYRRLFNDDIFWTSFFNNIRWLVAFITIPIVAGLGLALLLNNDLPGTRFFKAGFFSPMVVSSVVIGIVWSWMYQPYGLINEVLAWLGRDGMPIGFLADPDIVTWAIIAAGLWRQVGYVMLLYLAGLNNVDQTLVEASRVDGASTFRSFRDIVLPQLQPITVIIVVISIIDALRSFDLVNIMTRGGPYNQSNVLAQFMYIEAFNNYNMGYGAAIATILALISMVFIFTYLRRMVKTEMDY
ncbi:MAG TPA: sugar ABC transporter permease [Thermomicrobiales bacterium]|jgi:ABC-type sugar transport system permease subunit|nr:sugar ABC transporter permease [Thermomicrobiales bacterium]